MKLSEELDSLDELHRRGVLTDHEFARAKSMAIEGQRAFSQATAAINGLRRSNSERWIAGVCGGLGRATGLAPWVWRLLFTLLAVCGGIGLVSYALMWIFVPRDPLP